MKFLIFAALVSVVVSCASKNEKISEATTYSSQEKVMNPEECVSKAMSVQEEARQAIIQKDGPKDFKFHSAKHTDSSALAIDGGILKRTYGPSGFVQMVFHSGKRKCAVTVATKNEIKILADQVTCQ